MKKLFITGGAGFIGSAFTQTALAAFSDAHVVTFDALTYAGNLENLEECAGRRHTFIRGDIADRSAVLDALEPGTDAIINFAAESHVDRSISSADAFVRTNVLGTQVLLDAARHRHVRRFVQISTDEVMGSLPDDSSAFFSEESPFEPNSPYAASKAAAEHLVRAAHKTHGLDVVITRCGNNYGPHQFPEKFIPLVIANALSYLPIPVYGDGRNVRDWIYVDDHCDAILRVLLDGKSGEVYNIGARNELRNLDVLQTILKLLNRPMSLLRFVPDRLGHDRRYAIDPSRIESQLDWRPKESWQTGLAKTIAWYVSHSGWMQRVRSGAYQDYYKTQYRFDESRMHPLDCSATQTEQQV
jgi:dTDP-glucose 4,6-dehydratase